MRKNVLILAGLSVIIVISLIFGLRKVCFRGKEIEDKPKVAIVIDDWGYNLKCLNILEGLNVPITVSILPNLRYSSKTAKKAKELNQEVILHLPMDPETQGRTIGLEKNTITTEMSDEEVLENLKLAFASVPGACGVSNHMGSRATCDFRLMSVIFSELNKRKLFFLDNLVTNKSVCEELTGQMKTRFVSRDFFLDNLDEDEYIAGRFKELTELVLERGEAVAVGHARTKTMKALKEAIPRMQEEGIEFIFVSELVE